MKQNEDRNDLEKIASGDHDAFRSIFIKYYPKTKYFVTHIVKSEDVAEDLSQDIFLKIWINKELLPNLISFNAYIYKMAKFTALDYLKHKHVENTFAANYSQPATTDPEEELNAKDLEFLIELAIDMMPEQRQKIYIMSRIENIKNKEIAKTLGISEKTVNNQISLALKEIRNLLALAFLFFI